jgi:DNA-directed RNA polymerase subunit RPC12/RpoP
MKEFRAPEALALIAADREHQPLVCPSCGTRTIQRVPRRRPAPASTGEMEPGVGPGGPAERISLTCSTCGRHASYLAGGEAPPRDATMDPRNL